MRHASLYRVGGNALLLGAILYALGILLHAPQPTDLSAFAALSAGSWMISHWLFSIGTVLTMGGLLALARHLNQTPGEGWSTLGLGTSIATSAVFLAVVAPEIAGFGMLAQMNADGSNVGAQHAFLAISANMMGLLYVAGPLFWAGIGFFALALLQDSAWPRWLGQAGVAVAVIEVVSGFILGENWLATKVVFVLGSVWLALVGNTLVRLQPASVPAKPAVPAGA